MKNGTIIYGIFRNNEPCRNSVGLPHINSCIKIYTYNDKNLVDSSQNTRDYDTILKASYLFTNKEEALTKKLKLIERNRQEHIKCINDMFDEALENIYIEEL